MRKRRPFLIYKEVTRYQVKKRTRLIRKRLDNKMSMMQRHFLQLWPLSYLLGQSEVGGRRHPDLSARCRFSVF